MSWCKKLHVCECPEWVSYTSLVYKPRIFTPLDKLGFPQRFCFCCPLGVASIFICILSFLWAVYEIQTVEKHVALLVPEKGDLFRYMKCAYLVVTMIFVLACGSLMLGIIFRRHEPITVFIWCALIFNMLVLLYSFGTSMYLIIVKGKISGRQNIKLVFGVVWACLFFYLLMVVNSYKLKLLYRSLGFGL